MSSGARWRAVLAEVDRAGLCAHPVRLRGVTLDPATGELVEGAIVLPCKDRRAAVCPACSRLYQSDAWHLVAAGIRGGKGVSPGVVEHPQLFVTLTAPSFGAVHGRRVAATGAVRLCRPRRDSLCPHGRPTGCFRRHDEGDPVLGDPLCADCFDYRGAVLWNAHVPALWLRTSSNLYLEVGRAAGLSDHQVRDVARLSYMKVAEFQRRGLVHLHLVLRADGPGGPDDPPPPWLDATVLTDAVRRSIARGGVRVPTVAGTALSRAAWGTEHDIRVLLPGAEDERTAVAAYVAKYATKTADGTGRLAQPIRSAARLERLGVRPHLAQLVRTAWVLGRHKELAPLRLQAHAHTLGYTGQFSSKSLRYSTTFRALRGARARYAKGEPDVEADYDSEWRYAGRGYADPVSDDLARALFEVARKVPQNLPQTSTPTSTGTSTRR